MISLTSAAALLQHLFFLNWPRVICSDSTILEPGSLQFSQSARLLLDYAPFVFFPGRKEILAGILHSQTLPLSLLGNISCTLAQFVLSAGQLHLILPVSFYHFVSLVSFLRCPSVFL